MAHQRIRFQLALPASEYLRFYQGSAQSISVLARDGRRIQFPARHLRPFVTSEGIYGEFELELDDQHRLLKLLRLGPR